MNKMIKLFVIGATVVNFAAHVNAMENDKEGIVLPLSKKQKEYRTKLRQERSEARNKALKRIEAQNKARRRRNKIIKYVVGTALITGAAATLGYDLYYNNGAVTKKFITEPVKRFGTFVWNKLPAVQTSVSSNATSFLNSTKSLLSSLWNKIPAPAMPAWFSFGK